MLVQRTKLLRFFTVFMAIVIVVGTTTTSISHAAITNGKSATSKVVTLGSGKDGKSYQNPHHSWGGQFKYTVKIGGTDYIGYCMQSSKDFTNGKSYTVKNYKSAAAYKALSASRQRVLALVMLYGYNKGKSTLYGNTNDYYAATQTMVWQAVTGKLTVNSTGKVTNSTSGDYNLIKGHSYAVKCYNKMKDQISDHVKGASFTKTSTSSANSYTMKYSYSTKKWSVTLTDTNKANYLKKLAATTSGLSVSRSGYKYTFSASKAGTYTAAFANSISTGTNQAMMVIQPSSSANQAVILGATDETDFYVKLKTEAVGTAKIIKTSDNGVVKGFQFKLTCATNGYSGTFTTNSSGLITASLQPGTYKVHEILTGPQIEAGYIAADDTTIAVSEGRTASVKVHNKFFDELNKVSIIKQTTDGGPVGGFKFKIEGLLFNNKTLTSNEVIAKANPVFTDADYEIGNWIVNTEDLENVNAAAEKGKIGSYTIKLTNTAKLKEQQSAQPTDPIEPTEPSGAIDPTNPTEPTKPETISLKIPVTVNLLDAKNSAGSARTQTEKNMTYNNFDWTGSATNYSTIGTTNAKGQFAIEDLEFGTYTVTEIMTEEQQKRYHQPQSQTIVLKDDGDIGVVTFSNQARTGDLKIKKSCVDGKIADVEMTITGKTAWGEEITPIVQLTDDKGYIHIENLAAGTYTIAESNLDPEVYVKQDPKTIVITGEEVNPIEVEFTNVPYTDVEISKQSETTGEELPGASLQVIDKETGKVVDEWISMIEPHMVKGLEYGKEYILHEDLAPIGYVCAQDITFTAGGQEKVTMVDEISKLYITKIDQKTKKYLPGASFEIKEKDAGKVVANFTTPESESEDSLTYTEITGLIEGKEYVIHETEAPEGYKLGEDQTIIFKNKMTIAITNVENGTVIIQGDDNINKATGAIQTGDDWSMLPYILLSAAGAVIAGIVWLRRKDKGDIYR